MTDIKQLAEQDIWDWIENYIEVPNKFYDYKYPVCPYAKAARQQGVVDVVAWDSGNIKEFIKSQTFELLSNGKFQMRALVMPPRSKWQFGMAQLIKKLNAEIIPHGYYIQFGDAVKTSSKYPGWFNSGKYFVVMINKLGPVLEGHKALLKTDYYKPWSKQHYDAVVTRRQKLHDKYKDGNKSRCPFHRFKL